VENQYQGIFQLSSKCVENRAKVGGKFCHGKLLLTSRLGQHQCLVA